MRPWPGGGSDGSEEKRVLGQNRQAWDVLLCSLTILNLFETKNDKGKKESLASAHLALGGRRSNESEEKKALGKN